MYLRTSHCVIALVAVLVLIVGVGLVVYFVGLRGYMEATGLACDQGLVAKPNKGGEMTTTPPSTELTTPSIKPTTAPEIRLPTDLYPAHYDLMLQPNIYGDDPKKFTFDGSVSITLACNRSTDRIVLHTKNLKYPSPFSLTHSSSGRNIDVSDFSFDLDRDFLTFNLRENLVAGEKYLLTAIFTASLTKDLIGLYLSSYKRENKTIYLVASQIQPTNGREVFPCFDEPAIKSVFKVSLVRKSHLKSLCNMEIMESRKLKDDLVMDVYHDTVKMSLYLLAFVISDFVNASSDANGTRISVWMRPDFAGQGDYALSVASKLIPFYAKFFQSSYPLPKLDMIAVPDFAPGAMENWGLVIYRESAMLYDPAISPLKRKRRVAIIVSHELAHMWFGNLVTLSWWEDLWLNEGFASFVEYLGVDYVQPSWRMFENFRAWDTEPAMTLDSLKTSHPLFVPVSHPDEINDIFDKISYSKGSHVIKMMRFFLGEKKFSKGLKLYLSRHAYSDATNNDLWRALGEGNDEDVIGVMSTWVQQMNYPVVQIRRVNSQNGDGSDRLEMIQERFVSFMAEPESSKYTSPYGYEWRIPMSVISNSSHSRARSEVMWMGLKSPKRVFKLPYTLAHTNWILGNPNNEIFCRVNYDEANWRLLIGQLQADHTKISTIDRTTLVQDACKLARASYVNTKICLNVLSYMHKEHDYSVLAAAVENIAYMARMFGKRRIYGDFTGWVKSKATILYEGLPDTDNDTSIQEIDKLTLITSLACGYGNARCLSNLNIHFRKITGQQPCACQCENATMCEAISNTGFDQNLRPHVYCYGVQQGSVADWWTLYGRLENVNVAERSMVISALGCTERFWLLHTYLELAMDEMRTQNIRDVFRAVARNAMGRDVVFDYLRNSWDKIVKKLGDSVFSLTTVINVATTGLNTQSELEQLQRLIAAESRAVGAGALAAAVANTRANIEWMTDNENIIYNWLKQNAP